MDLLELYKKATEISGEETPNNPVEEQEVEGKEEATGNPVEEQEVEGKKEEAEKSMELPEDESMELEEAVKQASEIGASIMDLVLTETIYDLEKSASELKSELVEGVLKEAKEVTFEDLNETLKNRDLVSEEEAIKLAELFDAQLADLLGDNLEKSASEIESGKLKVLVHENLGIIGITGGE